ncbi:MAG: TonB-dependent receptor [Pedobacter sp.]|uniref:TonB-dependent receptor n=1 Tax=Pedobacter sp. TaxID=1411316 RepID=UPI003397DAF4
MKINAIILITMLTAAGSIMASGTKAQTMTDVNVSVGLNQGTLLSALSKIESQSDFRFAYKKELISSLKEITISQQTRSVKLTLDELLAGTGISYKQLNNSIILFKPEPTSVSATAQEPITGTVKDEAGLPIPGVSVKIKGQPVVAITDQNGRFSISSATRISYLQFIYIGYATQEYKAEAGQSVQISLKPDVGTLDAVVVIGYGTTTKRNNTGAVASVTSKDIASQPVSDPLAALQGRVAGLDISGSNGYSGSAYTVRLRGINSITGGNDPLYIVDGVPFGSATLNQFSGANGSSSPLNSINPADIDRIDVLKDADATAIYGSRGANGVILITTKKGKAGKTSVDANVYSGISFVNHKVDVLNTAQYLALRKEAFANDKITPTVDNALDLLSWDQTANTDWQEKLIGNTAKMTEAQLSLSGGSDLTNFLVSGTYRKETTVLPGDQGYQRGAFNFNLNHKSADNKFSLSTSVKYVGDQNNSMPTDVTQYYNTSPNYPIYNADGTFYWPTTGGQNPIAYLERQYLSTTQNLSGNTVAKYVILPGFNAQVSAGYNRISMKQTNTQPQSSFNPTLYTGSLAYYGNSSVNTWLVEPMLDYTKKISKGTLQVLAGGTLQSSTTEGSNVLGAGFASDEQLDNPKAAVTLTSQSYNYVKYKYSSVYARATYNWDERYILNGTFRRDGSSRFGPDNRFGNFGAIGAAWLFSNESFIKDKLSFLSFGKLRGSYGTVGNDQIGNYQYYDSWSATDFAYAGSGGLYPSRFANKNYGWEVNHKLEAAVELGFLKDRILLTADYYRNKSSNQLIQYVLSSQSGYTSYIANLPAEVENKGWEFELSTVNINKGNFKWNSAFNLTFAKNRLLKYPGLAASSYANTLFIGQPLNVVTGYLSTGINPATGIPTFVDKNGNGTITNPADMFVLGTTTPKFYGGFQNTLSYKNLSLSFFFQFVKQDGPLLNYGTLSGTIGSRANKDLSALDRWTTAGQVTDVPIATATTGAAYAAYNQWRLSSANWGDASYIRLKNATLRYNLGSVFKNLKISNFSIYLQGQNLFTITNYNGFDPETKGLVLPPLSIYTAGLQVSF